MGNHVTFLGVEGAGKTVLTMALLKCFKAHEAEGWFLRPESNNAFRFLNQLPADLDIGSLPHQTVGLRYLALNVLKDHEPQRTFDILDYPGEVFRLAFLDAKDTPDPEAFRERVEAHRDDIDALLGHLVNSDQVFVLFNLEDSRDLATNTRNSDAVWITNACLDYLHRLPSKPKITLLLTQIDRYVDLVTHDFNPGAYVAHHLPLIAQNFPNLDILAVSALGPTEATYGLDKILLRCLYDTPFVQQHISALQSATATINQTLPDLFRLRTQALYDTLTSAITNYNTASAQINAAWFLPPENLVSAGLTLSPEAATDIATLLPYAQEAVRAEQVIGFAARRQAIVHLSTLFSRLSLTSSMGKEWQKEGNLCLRKALTLIKSEERRCRGALICIGVIVGVIVSVLPAIIITSCIFDSKRSETREDAPSAPTTNAVRPAPKQKPSIVIDENTPLEGLRSAAEQGNPEAQFQLGSRYSRGDGVPQDIDEAAKWFRKAAEQGMVKAQLLLALLYESGKEVTQDITEVVEWFRRAAVQGDSVAQMFLGFYYLKGKGIAKDDVEAVKWFRKAAEQGEREAQFELGVRYVQGEGVAKNATEAVKWFRKAAKQGHGRAQVLLGFHYEEGEGVAKDDAEAVKWFREGAKQGIATAQLYLGIHYAQGQGVVANDEEAVRWFRAAAEQGDATAQFQLAGCYYLGKGIARNRGEAVRWYLKAAEQGDKNAQTVLGYCYEEGEGCIKNDAESVKWYRKAAEQGVALAQHRLGTHYISGTGVTKDESEAVKWVRKAAEQEFLTAQLLLGICYEGGFGVAEDEYEAVMWYRKAARLGHKDAQEKLRKKGLSW